MKLELGKTYETISCHKVKIISIQHELCTGLKHQIALGQMAECGSIAMWQLDGTPVRSIGFERNHALYNLKGLAREDIKEVEMKFEIGKFYGTRNCSKVLIVDDRLGPDTLQGYNYTRKVLQSWRLNGKAATGYGPDHDLVVEWIEPEKKYRQFAYQCIKDGLTHTRRGEIRFIDERAGMEKDYWKALPWLDEPKEI